MWLLFLGKFETLGSNFSYETAGLLASLTTTLGSLFLRLFLRQIINSHHIKRTFHCSKSNGSQSGYHYLGKFETLGSNFRHETPLVLLPKFSTTFTDFILLRTLLIQKRVVRQILLVRNHRQDFLHAKKRNPGYD